MNHASAYVIGLTPYHLLKIDMAAYANVDLLCFEERIGRITHGFYNLCEVTLIPDRETARDVLKEIQLRYNEIAVYNNNILAATIEGNDFDPNKLHIYEVNVGMDVI